MKKITKEHYNYQTVYAIFSGLYWQMKRKNKKTAIPGGDAVYLWPAAFLFGLTSFTGQLAGKDSEESAHIRFRVLCAPGMNPLSRSGIRQYLLNHKTKKPTNEFMGFLAIGISCN